MSLHRYFLAAVLLAMCLFRPAHAAAVYTEVGDAGDAIATAQAAGSAGNGLTINGSLSLEPALGPDYVDIFSFFYGGGFPLQISTGSSFDPSKIADPVLYLFDSSGVGIAMDDESGGFGQATLLTSLAAGTYYLAIAFAGVEPLDGLGNSIFDVFGSLAVLSTEPLASWLEAPFANDPSTVGAYSISIAAIPLPGTLLLLFGALAAAGLSSRARPRFRGQAGAL